MTAASEDILLFQLKRGPVPKSRCVLDLRLKLLITKKILRYNRNGAEQQQ